MISPEILRRFPLFADLDATAFKELAMIGEEVAFDANQWVFREGDKADSLIILLSGSVDLTIKIVQDGAEANTSVETVIQGSPVGLSAIVAPHTYRFGCRALAPIQVVKFDGAKMREWMDKHPESSCKIMYRIAQSLKSRLNNIYVRFVSLVDNV